jgi:hypothetical protein
MAVDQLVAVGRVDTEAHVAKQIRALGARHSRPTRNISRRVCDVTMDRRTSPASQRILRTACGRANQSEQQADRRRLAGTVWAQEREHLAGRDGQAQILDGHNTIGPLGQTVDADGRAKSSARRAIPRLKRRSPAVKISRTRPRDRLLNLTSREAEDLRAGSVI